jgi:hypothetical protein
MQSKGPNITLKGCYIDNIMGCFGQTDNIALQKRNEASYYNSA